MGSTSGWQAGGVFDIEVCEERPSLIVFRAIGRDAHKVFKDESGGHRWQRVPKHEKRGRVHSSTVTVAVLQEPDESTVRLDARDLEWQTTRSSGAGGQHVNKVESAVILRHRPSGLMVRVESERSQHQNRATALSLLRARLQQARQEEASAARSLDRRRQVGSGERGDKRRTIRCQDGTVQDHLTGRTWRFRDYERGEW